MSWLLRSGYESRLANKVYGLVREHVVAAAQRLRIETLFSIFKQTFRLSWLLRSGYESRLIIHPTLLGLRRGCCAAATNRDSQVT